MATTTIYTSKRINQNYIIKAYGYDAEGNKVNKLVGVDGYLKLVNDDELAMRLVDRVFFKATDKVVCKLRRGIKFTFYAH